MARIETYPKDLVVTANDKVIGTDGDNVNKTKNFPIWQLSQLILGQLKNSGLVLRFADGSNPNIQIGAEGYFFSEGNTVSKTQVTKFYFSETTLFGENLTALLNSVGSNLGDLYVGITQTNDAGNYGFFNILSVERVGNYFEIGVDLRGTLFSKTFKADQNYSLMFDLATNEYTIEAEGSSINIYKNGVKVDTATLTVNPDDINLARLVEGRVDNNGIATFIRDDGSAFTVNFSGFLGSAIPQRTSDLINDGEGDGKPFITDAYSKQEVDNKDAALQGQITVNADDIAILRNLDIRFKKETNKIQLYDGNNTLLAEAGVESLDDEGMQLDYDPIGKTLLLKDGKGNILDSVPVASFASGLATKIQFNAIDRNKLELIGVDGSVVSFVNLHIPNISNLQNALDLKLDKDDIEDLNENLTKHNIARIGSVTISETVTRLIPTELVGQQLPIRYVNENGVEQVISVNLSGLVTNESGINNATYDAANNIITLEEVDGDLWTIDLSEFSIVVNTDPNGVTTLTQEGEVKLTVSRVGQTGEYDHLLNKPDLSVFALDVDLQAHINDKSNPHDVTAAQVGLGNVDNTSDANKPISDATQLALNNKSDKGHSHSWTEITEKPTEFNPVDHLHTWTEITGKPAVYPPEIHTHTKADIVDFAHTHSWTEITGKPSIPSNTSDLTNDSGFITEADIPPFEQDNKVRVVYIDPANLPENFTKEDVATYLTNDVLTKEDIETIIISIDLGDNPDNPDPDNPDNWVKVVLDAYEPRVNSDYGVLENRPQLATELTELGEENYNDAIAIYNPNGGYRTGKIYDLRDTSNAVNLIPSSEYFSHSSWSRVELALTTGHSDPFGNNKATFYTNTGASANLRLYKDIGAIGNISMYIKPDYIWCFPSFFLGSENVTRFGINDGVVTFESTSNNVTSNHTVSDEGDGWFRISFDFNSPNTINDLQFRLTDGASSNSTDDDTFYLFGYQVTNGLGLKDYSRTPSYDLTVTGGGGTRINSEGNLEPVPVNLYDRGAQSNLGNLVYDNSAISPTGDTDARRIELSSSYTATRLTDLNGFYNFSVFAKAESGNPEVELRYTNGGSSRKTAKFNLSIGQITLQNEIGSAVITTETNGYYRISITTPDLTDGQVTLLWNSPGIIYWWNIQLTRGVELKPSCLTELNLAAFPKIDYSTGQPAFLIEPQRTNVFLHNTDLTNSYWESSNVIETGLLAPDKSNTAVRINRTFRNLNDYTYVNDGTSSQVFSVWVRSNVNSTFRFNVKDEGTSQGYSPDFQATTEWQKFEYNPGHSGNPDINCRIQSDSQGNPLDIEIWGPQLEVNQEKATSTIITNSSAVTRTTKSFETEISEPLKGYFFIEISGDSLGAITLNDGTTNRLLGFNLNAVNGIRPYYKAYSNGVNVYHTTNQSNKIKALIVYDSSSYSKFFVNGSLIESSPNPLEIKATRLDSMIPTFPTSKFTGNIYDMILSSEVLTDQEAIELTTL